MALSRSDEEKKNAEDQVKEEVVEKKLSSFVLKLKPKTFCRSNENILLILCSRILTYIMSQIPCLIPYQ